jgi:acetylornithine/succinyldiaminopimelate/putrescine aminotransferase/predicted amino acid dehydrogenase
MSTQANRLEPVPADPGHRDGDAAELYARHVRPRVAQMMRAVRLDVVYHRAQGDWLFHDADGREIAVLDALGGYGSTFFGHNHPALTDALIDSVRRQRPFAAQASVRAAPARLAARLSTLFEAFTGTPAVVTFTNSGAETVEAARKHAVLAHENRQQAAIASARRQVRQMTDRIEAGTVSVGDAAREDWTLRFGAPAPRTWPAMARALLRRAEQVLSAPAGFVSLDGAFHGKTGGALALTHGEQHRRPFRVDDAQVAFVDPFAPDASERLTDAVAQRCRDLVLPVAVEGELRLVAERRCALAALFFEPVQGEGGIRELPAEFLRQVRALADEHGFAVVADEIQTGMGRCGHVFASEQAGVAPDYCLLSKSLGGGLAKIGALLVRADRYEADFGLRHSSTFAEDEHSAEVALAALALLQDDALAERAGRKGAELLAGLRGLCRRYPHAFVDARGRGLLLGLQLRDLSQSQSPLARALSRQGLIGYVAAGFLLHHGRLRVAPSLSSAHTLRIEPSAYVDDAASAHLMKALQQLGQVLENQDYGALIEFATLDSRPAADLPVATRSYAARPVTFWQRFPGDDDAVAAQRGRERVRRVAFLGHFIHLDDVALWEPSFERLSSASRRVLLDRVAPVIAPHPILQRRVHGDHGRAVDFMFIGLTHDSAGIETRMRERQLEPLVGEIQQAVDLAEDAGCDVIGLGGYTSIVTRNGKALCTRRAVLTTGNSLTAAMTVEALLAAAHEQGIAVSGATLGVLGAGGNIGAWLTRVLAPRVGRVVLVGRPGRLTGLQALAAELGAPARVTHEVAQLADADLVVGASNSAGEPLAEVVFADRPRVVCDVAVPPDAPADLPQRAPRTRLVMGGLVQVPNAPDFRVPGVPLAAGRIFACMAETMTLGLTPSLRPARLGRLEADAVRRIARAAHRAGLTLAEAKQARSF